MIKNIVTLLYSYIKETCSTSKDCTEFTKMLKHF